MGISKEGAAAQARFCALTGACDPDSAAAGDAKFEGRHVEVKRASSTTINQVRAVKYIPMIVLEKDTTWYVVPAHRIVALLASRPRGQHTENVFESATLSTRKIQEYRVEEKDLKTAVRAAIAAADGYPKLKEVMARVLANCRELAMESRAEVMAILTELRIPFPAPRRE